MAVHPGQRRLGRSEGEICAIRWSDINWVQGSVRIDESIISAPGGGLEHRPHGPSVHRCHQLRDRRAADHIGVLLDSVADDAMMTGPLARLRVVGVDAHSAQPEGSARPSRSPAVRTAQSSCAIRIPSGNCLDGW